jgi:hypothetical protein
MVSRLSKSLQKPDSGKHAHARVHAPLGHILCVYIHTYIRAYIHICTCATHPRLVTVCVCVQTHTHTHTYVYVYMHTCIHIYIHTYMHTCKHTYIHTYIHAYIHTYSTCGFCHHVTNNCTHALSARVATHFCSVLLHCSLSSYTCSIYIYIHIHIYTHIWLSDELGRAARATAKLAGTMRQDCYHRSYLPGKGTRRHVTCEAMYAMCIRAHVCVGVAWRL